MKPKFINNSQVIPILVILSEIKEPERCLYEALQKQGFDDSLIETILQKGRKKGNNQASEYCFLILFDGYDELRKPINLYVLNSLEDYNCKVIYSSRREYLKAFGVEYMQYFSSSGRISNPNNVLEVNIPNLNFI